MAVPEVETFLNELEELLTRHLGAIVLEAEDIEGRQHLMVGDFAVVVEVTDLEDPDEGWIHVETPLRMRFHHVLGLLEAGIEAFRDDEDEN